MFVFVTEPLPATSVPIPLFVKNDRYVRVRILRFSATGNLYLSASEDKCLPPGSLLILIILSYPGITVAPLISSSTVYYCNHRATFGMRIADLGSRILFVLLV